MGDRQYYIIECYLAPNNALKIGIVVAAPIELPWGIDGNYLVIKLFSL